MPTLPDPSWVARKRYRMRRTLLFCALVLFMIFLIGSLFNFFGSLEYGPDVEDLFFETLQLGSFALGALLLVAANRVLVRWMVPYPRPGCPFCRHAGLPETGSCCTECGRELPAELLARSSAPPA